MSVGQSAARRGASGASVLPEFVGAPKFAPELLSSSRREGWELGRLLLRA